MNISSGVSVRLLSISFVDDNIGVASGDNETILQTTNGGSNWVIRRDGGLSSLFSVCGVSGINNNTYYAVGGYNPLEYSS